MASLDQIRDAGEAKLRGLLSRLSKRHRERIKQAIVQYGSIAAIPNQFWTDLQREIEEEEVAALLLLMLPADDWTATQIRRQWLPVEKVSETQLADYGRVAGERAQVFGQQWVDTTRERLLAKEEAGELMLSDVNDVLDKGRVDRAAMSQATNIVSRAQLGARERALAGDGAETAFPGQRVSIELIWTNNILTTQQPGDRTCPICRPLHGTDESVWGLTQPSGPGDDVHPTCKCGLRPTVIVESP